MPGPFLEYTNPDVYTRTLTDQTVTTLTGGLRIPLFIGVGSETLPLTDTEIVRGSSAIADNTMVNEDVSPQLDGANREFYVAKFPIVKGDGTGTITNIPTDVKVTINGDPVGVAQVFGLIGKVVLSTIPKDSDVVLISYFFKRTDTYITNENLSEQADGSNKIFKVYNIPIVDGSNGGVATTDTSKVILKVNGAAVELASVDGQTGFITLKSAPISGDIVQVSYWTNMWQDTFDYLPVNNVVDVIRVGTAPGRSDFNNLLDFVIEENRIQWGNSFSIAAGTTAPASTPWSATQLNSYLFDNKVYARPLSGASDGSNKDFNLEYIPTEGTGLGRPTDDISKVIAYVGTDVKAAIDAGAVVVTMLSAHDRKLTLKVAPAVGQKVYATYWHNMIADDQFTFTSVTPSTPLIPGIFTLKSFNNGDCAQLLEDRASASVADADFAAEGVIYPLGGFDGQTLPGYSPEETVLVHFLSDKDYHQSYYANR